MQVKDILGRLASYRSGPYAARLERPLERLGNLIDILAPSGTAKSEPAETTAQQLEEWQQNAAAQTTAIQQELRLIRRSSAFGAK